MTRLADDLARRLAPQGFALNLPETMKNGISFARISSTKRLYEHVLIRPGRSAYAETVLSGASFTSCHTCVSEVDGRFRVFLAGNSEFGCSSVFTPAEARAWRNRLVDNADSYCKRMSMDLGPALLCRLQPVFNALDGYIAAFGDVFAIFDREYSFVNEAASDERAEASRWAGDARGFLYLNSEDAMLASLVIVRFGNDVEGREAPFKDEKPRQGTPLAARLILLADYLRHKRLEYERAGGLYRGKSAVGV